MSKELIEITSLLRMRFVTNDTCHKAADRIEELERDLLNLVCRIHRDGGHYIAKYGEAKAIADADTVVAQNNADLDALQADNAELVAVLELLSKYIAYNGDDWVQRTALEALARARKP